MKKTTLLLSALLVTQVLFAQTEVEKNAIKTGKAVTKKLMSTLEKNLKKHMKEGGPLAAVKFCNVNATSLTHEVDKGFGAKVHVKRISLKTRNSSNMPTDSEAKILQKLQAMHESKKLPPFLLHNEQGSMKFYKPLVIKKQVCLKCHGDIKSKSKLGQFLQEYYPTDKAINYKMNDFRGAVVVEMIQK